ncbi:MAG: melibiose:sodium transporter MelB [Culicoidibacterales bacterium]
MNNQQKLSNLEKYSYGFGALGKDLVCALVFTYLMFYFTDVLGISSAFVGGLFFFARFWDAINDPVMGMVVENTRTKWGKFRPWILIGTLINAVSFVFLFSTPEALQGTGLYIYVTVTYIVWGMTYTIMDIPYWSMLPSLTTNKNEREKIAVIPRIFASLAWLLIGTFGLQVVSALGNGNNYQGYSILSIIIAVIFVVASFVTVLNVKERSSLSAAEQKAAPKTGFKEMINVIKANDQLRAFVGTILSFNMAVQLAGGFAIYYFTYVIGNTDLYSVFMMFGAAEMIGLAIFPMVAKRLPRPVLYAIACVLPIFGLVLLLISGILFPLNGFLISVSAVLMKLGSGFSLALATVMLADVVDYGQYKLGTRNEGVIFSVQTLLVKFAGAIAGLIVGFGLAIIGYEANVQQTAATILGMRVLMIGVPIGLMGLSFFFYKNYYKLNGDFHENILAELEASKASQPFANGATVKA